MTTPALILVLGAPALPHSREFPSKAYAGEVREVRALTCAQGYGVDNRLPGPGQRPKSEWTHDA